VLWKLTASCRNAYRSLLMRMACSRNSVPKTFSTNRIVSSAET